MRRIAILKNRFGGKIEQYEPTFKFENDFYFEGELRYMPCIVMPLGKNKDYFQFDAYNLIWSKIQEVLKDSTMLVCIGCAVNDADERLWQHLENLKKDTAIRIVSGNRIDAESVANKFKQRSFTNTTPMDVNGFCEYAESYLANDKI